MFQPLKQNLGVHKFKDDREVETFVTGLLITQDMDRQQQGIQKLVPRYDKCLNCSKDYVEK